MTHDLGVVSKVCQTMTVLYAGMVVEDTTVRSFFAGPTHAYARALLGATPRYTDPEGSLLPVSETVIEQVRAEVAAADAGWRHG